MIDKKKQAVDLCLTSFGKLKSEHYDLVVLPWGATEPHNLHLPYLTDCILSHEVAVEAAVLARGRYGVNCMVLPPVSLGSQNPGQWIQPFCIHTRYETQKAILTDIVFSLYAQGFRKLVIVNGHGGNTFKSMIRDLAVDYPDFLIAVTDWFSIVPQKGYFEVPDSHAGELETSVMMHYHPELVSLEEAGSGRGKPFAISSLNEKTAWIPRDWSRVTDDTGYGDPRKASAEKGRKYAGAVVSKLLNLFVELAQKEVYN